MSMIYVLESTLVLCYRIKRFVEFCESKNNTSWRLLNIFIKLVSARRKIRNESLSTNYFPHRSVVSFGETTRSIGVEGKTQVIIKFSSFVISTTLPEPV